MQVVSGAPSPGEGGWLSFLGNVSVESPLGGNRSLLVTLSSPSHTPGETARDGEKQEPAFHMWLSAAHVALFITRLFIRPVFFPLQLETE